MKFIILLPFLFVSCASLKADWSPWIDQDVTMNERRWDICQEEKYGVDLHLKGFCWSLKECRTKKVLFSTRKECRVKIVHCKWGDIQCMIKYNLDNAELIIK